MGSPTITYRAAGPWGAGKGADLDAGEIDNNFYSIAQSIQSLIDNPPTPNNISSIEVINNNQLLITLDDYRTFGPFDLPIASFSDRGEWAAVTLYNYGDIFTHLSSLYMVLQEHTSAASFNASDGNMAGPYYRLLFSAANLMLEWTEEWLPSHAYTVFDLNLPNCVAHLEVAVTAALEFTLQYAGDTIGTITFNPGDLLDGDGGQFATIAGDGATIHNAELLRLISPTHTDVTASFLSVALRGHYEAVSS
jgi:hypothetical protein